VSNPWQREFWRISGLVLAGVGVVLGFLVGNLALGLLIVAVLYLGWHLYNIHLLICWLREGRKFRPPDARGIWDDVFEHIFRLQKRNRKRKRELRSMLKRFHKITVALPDATVELRPGSEQIEWWNDAAAKYLGFEYPRDTGQRISNLLRHPAFVEYLHQHNYDQVIEMPSPVDEGITLRIRVIPYSGNRRLVVARDMTLMQKLERMRQDFVANVSHELRSPLTVVSGYLETLIDAEDVGVEFAGQLKSMQQQTTRMNRIVDDLMLLSRLENEIPGADPQAVSVATLIDSIVEQGRELSGAAEHTIKLDVDDTLCIKGSESELYSAFSNLVFNAIRYTQAGGHIAIRWKLSDGEPVFSVEDTGAGIAPYHIPRLTERFYRIDTGRSRATGGAIVKHVLLRHDAELEIDSELGKGSCFRCRFPSYRHVECEEKQAGLI